MFDLRCAPLVEVSKHLEKRCTAQIEHVVSEVSGIAGLDPQGWPHRAGPAVQLFSLSQATHCSYKFSELSILAFTITHVNIYRHPIKNPRENSHFRRPFLLDTMGGGGGTPIPPKSASGLHFRTKKVQSVG